VRRDRWRLVSYRIDAIRHPLEALNHGKQFRVGPNLTGDFSQKCLDFATVISTLRDRESPAPDVVSRI